jgi:tetratricopeptide (TPR) repeat protein
VSAAATFRRPTPQGAFSGNTAAAAMRRHKRRGGYRLAGAYFMARRYDEAIAELRRVLERDPTLSRAHGRLGWAYARKGMYREALAESEKCGPHPACQARVTVWAHAVAGHADRALAVIEQMKLGRPDPVPSMYFARAYAGVGRPDETLSWLEKAYQDRDPDLIFLRIDPDWDLLRGNPRFAALIRRVGIPPSGPAPS